ncbi:hypothetical protein P8452_32124 [Trifolium repens]|nr:hypothetical protein P8452_32124 [Trifolium repens]
MIEDNCANSGIPIPNITGQILAKVIEYCKKHAEVASSEEGKPNEDDLKAWDKDFINAVADNIKDKTPEEIRKIFNIKNDFTPEEEEEVRRENSWAFE